MLKIFTVLLLLVNIITLSQPFPDKLYTREKSNLTSHIELSNNVMVSNDGEEIVLMDSNTDGYAIFSPDSSENYFNRALPSWNGHVYNDSSAFKVLIRFYKNSWSPWLTVGYWKKNIFNTYGTTTYNNNEIKIDVDYAVLKSYYNKWQFQVQLKRIGNDVKSPSVNKLSLFVSDELTTTNVNISSIVNDNPKSIYIDTDHLYQYSIDPIIGGDICSPTSVSMVLKSYKIYVDPLKFAKDNYDNYWGMYGIWPRAVQNASEYNLIGEVTRYRTWSDAQSVLQQGGRIVMSVGPPLYTGHLIMLAGFDEAGNPIVHDPARSDGYRHKFNKTDLSKSWFTKGGVSYTFFMPTTTNVSNEQIISDYIRPNSFELNIYPNPFNPNTNVIVSIGKSGFSDISIFDLIGREITKLYSGNITQGTHTFNWNASNLPSGTYIVRVTDGNEVKSKKVILIK